MDTKAKRALYDNLEKNEKIAEELDKRIMATKKDGWRDHFQKSKAVRHAISEALNRYGIKDDAEVSEYSHC
jgi:type I restriction enzyme R subunit